MNRDAGEPARAGRSPEGAAGAPVLKADGAEPTRWLSEDEQQAWRSYLWAGRLLDKVLDSDLQEQGLNLPEYEILAMLSEGPAGGMRMSALADLVVQSRSRLSHTALRLERRGLVWRRQARGDRRGVELRLTDTGRAVVDRLSHRHVASVRAHFIDVVTAEELRVLGEAMGKVRAAIEAAADA